MPSRVGPSVVFCDEEFASMVAELAPAVPACGGSSRSGRLGYKASTPTRNSSQKGATGCRSSRNRRI